MSTVVGGLANLYANINALVKPINTKCTMSIANRAIRSIFQTGFRALPFFFTFSALASDDCDSGFIR